MKTAQDLYPEAFKNGPYDGPCSYQPMIDDLGTVLVQVDDDDYQGDTRVLVQNGTRFGWAQIGWGSCSGCDALQGAGSFADVQELLDSIRSGVRWFDTAAEAQEFFRTHDWKGDYSWHDNNQQQFVEKVIAYFEALSK